MKITIKLLTSVTIILSVLLLHTSCDGEDGAEGPRGEQGVSGLDGTNGEDGNANVIASDWFAPDSDSYTVTATSQGFFFLEHDKAVPEITQETLDNAVVLVYARLNAYETAVWPNNQASLMPITLTHGANAITQIDTWSALISVGNIKIRITNQNQDYSFQTNDLDPSSFRYVIIPSSQTTKEAVLDYKSMTYNEICALFDII